MTNFIEQGKCDAGIVAYACGGEEMRLLLVYHRDAGCVRLYRSQWLGQRGQGTGHTVFIKKTL